jgi:hypothetical protein
VIDKTTFSQKLLKRPEAKSQLALQRIYLAKKRVQSILDRETVSHQKTLEQKISSQGPTPQRVDPHLLGLAIMDLIETNRLKTYKHSTVSNWHSNIGASEQEVMLRLNDLAPLYASVSKGGFGNLTGDALEVITFKCLNLAYQNNALFAFLGDFKLNEAKVDGRFRKNQPPKFIGTAATLKEADFLQFGHSSGPLCIECKNYREWLYPGDRNIKQLIIKACELQAIPVLLARKIHYSTITNLLYPAGIIAHETYHQY